MHVTPRQLRDALAQANVLKQRLQSGRGLGLTPAQPRAQRAAGQSLADVAKARGKSVSGLRRAIEGTLKTRLDAAVKSGRLTAAQEQRILARFDQRLGALVQRRFSFRHP